MNEFESKKGSFGEFNDEILTTIEEERLSAEAPKVPHIISLEQAKIVRTLQENAKKVISYYYRK